MSDLNRLIDAKDIEGILKEIKAYDTKLLITDFLQGRIEGLLTDVQKWDTKDLIAEYLKDRIEELPGFLCHNGETRTKGKWIGSVCSVCGESVSEWFDCNFCPRCGAEMEDYEDG